MYKLNHLDTHGLQMKGILNACKATRKLEGAFKTVVEIHYNAKTETIRFFTIGTYKDETPFSGKIDGENIYFATPFPLTMQQIADTIWFNLKRYGVRGG